LGELYKRAIRMNAENQGSMREFLEFEIDWKHGQTDVAWQWWND
jgi:hypothetical protein